MNQTLISGSSILGIIEYSIKLCQKILGADIHKIMQLLKEDDRIVNAKLRYGIAERIIEYFVLYGVNVTSAYVFGSTIHEEGAGYYSDIDIILHVDEKKDEYFDIIAKIDSQLIEEIARKTGRSFPEDFKLLDIKLVTQEDVDKREVFACLINSIYDPACKIYPKQ